MTSLSGIPTSGLPFLFSAVTGHNIRVRKRDSNFAIKTISRNEVIYKMNVAKSYYKAVRKESSYTLRTVGRTLCRNNPTKRWCFASYKKSANICIKAVDKGVVRFYTYAPFRGKR